VPRTGISGRCSLCSSSTWSRGLPKTKKPPSVRRGRGRVGKSVAGFHVEYSGVTFALFFPRRVHEHDHDRGNSRRSCFLGGWLSPWPLLNDIENRRHAPVRRRDPLAAAEALRGAVPLSLDPRHVGRDNRYDQIMRLGWKVFIPVTLIWIVFLGVDDADNPWLTCSIERGADDAYAHAELFSTTWLLVELVQGLMLTGRHMFARKITVQFPEEKTPMRPALPRIARPAPLSERRRALQSRASCARRSVPALAITIESEQRADGTRRTTRYDNRSSRSASSAGFCEESCPVDSIVGETRILEYHGEKRGDLIYTKKMLAGGRRNRYEAQIAADRDAGREITDERFAAYPCANPLPRQRRRGSFMTFPTFLFYVFSAILVFARVGASSRPKNSPCMRYWWLVLAFLQLRRRIG